MEKMSFKKVSLEFMLQHIVDEITKGIPPIEFFFFCEDTGFHKIVECDLYRGRFVTEDGNFSEFEWEMEKSHIFVKQNDIS